MLAGWAGYEVAAGDGLKADGNAGGGAPGKVAGRAPVDVVTRPVAAPDELTKAARAHEEQAQNEMVCRLRS